MKQFSLILHHQIRNMKRFFVCILILLSSVGYCQLKETAFTIPDSLKVSGMLAEITVRTIHPKKENKAGIKVGDVYLFTEAEKKEREVAMEFPENFVVVAKGIDVEEGEDELEWNYEWQLNETYRLAVMTTADSASNFTLYSGYIYFPKQNKWKLIGTVKQSGKWGTVTATAVVSTEKKALTFDLSQAWFQKTNGQWKNIISEFNSAPIINPMSNIDSTAQATAEEVLVQQLIKENKTDATQSHESVYYKILKEGTGNQVKVTDTVTVFYKGYLLDGSVFDQTKDRPATFPLNRLIRGWQIGVPLLKVGGKIKILIPSGIAYGIRTRAAKIPPNSMLVFEVEVVGVK
jgi:FKBP-type peptidyl-prolyl cis-trans isomerase FkpA